jgi:hypothetical protein
MSWIVAEITDGHSTVTGDSDGATVWKGYVLWKGYPVESKNISATVGGDTERSSEEGKIGEYPLEPASKKTSEVAFCCENIPCEFRMELIKSDVHIRTSEASRGLLEG